MNGSLPRPAPAQFQVIDMANLGQAITQVAQLIQIFATTAQNVAALSQLPRIIAILARLQAISAQLGVLLQVIDDRAFGWHGLAGMTPCSGAALQQWNQQALTWARDGMLVVRSITSLSRETMGLLNEVSALINAIAGSTGGLQTVSSMLAQLITETQTLRTESLAGQVEIQGERVVMQINQLASVCLHGQMLQGWGTITTW